MKRAEKKREPKQPRKALLIRLPPEHFDLVRRAAEADTRSVNSWASVALYRQARTELEEK